MLRDDRTVIYYEDELNEEFSVAQIKPRCIDGNYHYDSENEEFVSEDGSDTITIDDYYYDEIEGN